MLRLAFFSAPVKLNPSPSRKHAYEFVVPIWIQRRRGGGEKIRAQKKKNKEFLPHVKLAKITDFIATLRAYL